MASGVYIVVGDNGVILKRSESGVYSAKASGVAANLTFVSGITGGPIYAGGVETLLRSDDNGESWIDISSAITWNSGEYVSQIHVRNATRVYIATVDPGAPNDGRLIYYNGSTWSDLYSRASAGQEILGCWGFTDVDIWISQAISGNDQIRRYTGSWGDVAGGPAGAGRFFGASASELYLCGSGASNANEVHKWTGVAWASDYTPGQNTARAIHGSASDNVVNVDTVITGSKFRAHRYDGTWSAEYTSATSNTTPSWVHVNGPQDAAAACEAGQVYKHGAGGWSLEGAATTGTSENLNGIWSPGDQSGPIIINDSPTAGSRDTPPEGPLSFTIHDELNDVDAATVRISINGTQIYDGSVFAVGWKQSTLQTASGDVVVVLRPTVPLSQRVNHLEVIAADEFGNPRTIRWGFLVRAPLPLVGDTFLVGDDKDLVVNRHGELERDALPRSRCLARILTRRGKWALAPNFGSRLHEIQITKGAYRRARDAIEEALKPLLDEGAIKAVRVEPITDVDGSHIVAVEAFVSVPGDLGVQSLGEFALS